MWMDRKMSRKEWAEFQEAERAYRVRMERLRTWSLFWPR